MKKFLLTLAAVVGLGFAATANTDTYYECLFGADYNQKGVSAYKSDWTTKNQGSIFKIINFNNNNNKWEFVKCGSKNEALVATITTDFSASEVLNQVVLNVKINENDKVNSIKLETSATADFATVTNTVSATAEEISTKTTDPIDITFAIANPAKDQYYRITFDCMKSAGNGSVWVYSVKYNGEAGQVSLKDAEMSFPEEEYTVTEGESFIAPTLSKATNATVTYSSDKETVATVDAETGAVTVVGAGTARITAVAEANDEFKAGSASYTLTVVDPNKPGVSIDNPMTVAQAIEACNAGAKDVYVKGVVTKIVTTYSSQYKNVTFNIADELGNSNVLEAYRAKWGEGVTPTADNNPVVGATVVLYGNLKLYNGKAELDANNQIVAYTAPELPSAGLSFPEASYTINLGESFTAPVLAKDTDAAVAYTSSNTAVADVDATTGAVTVKTYGSVIITAKAEATTAYLAGEASYTLVVNNPNITVEKPLTVAEALEVCENNPQNVYVKGVVTEIVTNYSSQYKNVTFNIADEAGATATLQAYRAVWGEDVTPTTDNNPEVGATVVVFGNLKVHNETKEFDAGNKIVKYVSPEPTGIEDIEAADNAPVEYFNLQGVRVANPENGLFIRRQGNKVSKVIVK